MPKHAMVHAFVQCVPEESKSNAKSTRLQVFILPFCKENVSDVLSFYIHNAGICTEIMSCWRISIFHV
jgi:hypothetical protein